MCFIVDSSKITRNRLFRAVPVHHKLGVGSVTDTIGYGKTGNGITGTMIEYPNIASFFSRHMVALAWVDFRPEYGQWGKQCLASCVLVSVDGCVLLVTAGHLFADMEMRLKQNPEGLGGWGIVDGLGPESRHKSQIPWPDFHPSNAHHDFEDEKGKDFEIYRLDDRPLIWQSLLANGKEPLGEEGWDKLPEDLDEYFLLGLPSQLQVDYSVSVESRCHRATTMMIPVSRNSNPPEALYPSAPRFFGEIEVPFEWDGEVVTSIDGMSGGPIIGMKKLPSGDVQYWLVAIQSGWLKPQTDSLLQRRPIAASFITPYCEEIRDVIRRLRGSPPA
jgi:hypothetical protein